MSTKTPKLSLKIRNQGRSIIPFNDPMARMNWLLTVGSKNPPFKLNAFIQQIRLHEDKKMSYEYKIFKKLCPVYAKTKDPTINKVFPYERYQNYDGTKHLWTHALVKLILNEETEKNYNLVAQRYYCAEKRYNAAVIKLVSEQKLQKYEKNLELARNRYLNTVDAINFQHPMDLFIGLTFRGLLVFLYEVHIQIEHRKNKKGKRDTEKNEKAQEMRRKKDVLRGLRDKVHKVIRNPYVIRDIPLLVDSELHESLGFDVVSTLLEISSELIDQLHLDANKDQYLHVRATERYIAEFDRFFFVSQYDSAKNKLPMQIAFIQPIETPSLIDKQTLVKDKKRVVRLNTYRKHMAELMRIWKLDELNEISTLIQKSSMLESFFKQEQSVSESHEEKGTSMIFSVATKDKDEENLPLLSKPWCRESF